MALTKQAITINFSEGLDTKTDSYQSSKFLKLDNSIFLKGGLLQKRNGYENLPNLPDQSFTTLSTFNGDLTAIGNQLYALSAGYSQWVNRGKVQPIDLAILPLIRNNVSQQQSDTAISLSGLVCTVYTTQDPTNLANVLYMYAVADVNTGQNIISPTLLPTGPITTGGPRVFLLGSYFVIVFPTQVGAVDHLSFIAVSTNNPNIVTPVIDITLNYVPFTIIPAVSQSVSWAFDGIVFNGSLYVAWNGPGRTIQMNIINELLQVAPQHILDPSHGANLFSLSVDTLNSSIWVTYYDYSTQNGYTLAVTPQLQIVVAVTLFVTATLVLNIATFANNLINTIFFEVSAFYPYNAVPTNFIRKRTATQQVIPGLPAILGTNNILILSVGLASKSFSISGVIYVLTVYQSPYQSTYFLIDVNANIVAELAYGNAKGYIIYALPSVTVIGDKAQVSYLIKYSVQSVNKNTNPPLGSQTAGVFSQIGINLVSFTFNVSNIITAEIGTNLHITGGITWAYDGYSSVEQGFFLYPDNVVVAASGTAGSMAPNTYFYQVTYEWTDNQGNAFRSAPSIPVSIALAAPNTSVNVNVPMLRLTYKVANPVKIVIYRWSLSQPSYYQVTSITLPQLNVTTLNSLTYNDKSTDAAILGNNLLYTTGGVLENIGSPSFASIFIFDNRLWGIMSENRNLLWFSKEVLAATPVEMSDLQTLYVAPNIGAQGPTGPLTCGASMDDRLILFKDSAINFINGTGPDATGANNQYSQPIFITSTVGCSNQHSIVFQPQGLMFEFSSKSGNQIWLLGRGDLSTRYIGAEVEDYTLHDRVKSAVNIPGTNQVRFTMGSGITLMYDYYYQQWGTFSKIPAISSTLYQGVHAFLNTFGEVLQETPGIFLDGSKPVLMSFTTAWFKLAGLKGYQRIYKFYLLATYMTPHLLDLQIAYDYNPNSLQYTTIEPNNFAPVYGQDLTYGSGSPYGGASTIEQWRVFLTNQRCESFQITLNERYDPRLGVPAGAGFTLSGINCVLGIKGSFIPMRADQSVG